LQDEECWRSALARFPAAEVHYRGFVSADLLQEGLGGCAALVMTSKWIEAFGNVAIEALACGLPVVAYDRGGPAEIVVDGATGFLVPPDDTAAVARAVGRLGELSRADCRARAEAEFSTLAFAQRVENWLLGAVAGADFGRMPLSF
jgi:UDP-glucose:tetrahydrobiopterin glucosyltransferase